MVRQEDNRPAMSSPEGRSRTKTWVIWVVAMAILIPAGLGFVDKLVQFFRTVQSDSEGAFAIMPILNYLIIAAGMVCLLVWAIAHGMFRDVEGPKYTMLEREAQLDRDDPLAWSQQA